MNLRTWWAERQIPYERLSQFAGNLATCLESGLGLPASLETTRRALHGTPWLEPMRAAATAIRQGESFAAALSAACPGLPSFFVPMVEAGEVTGRLDESLRFLETHCRMLARPAAALRTAWLIPLAVILAGTVIQLLAYLCFASWGGTWQFVWGSLKSYGAIAVFLLVAFGSPFRPLVDFLKLHLPFLSSLERDVHANRFFHALAMLHAAAGHRVEQMIRISTRGVSNQFWRSDLQDVAARIEQGSPIAESFEAATYLSPVQKQLIATGDLTGTLERSYQRIADDASQRMQYWLALFQVWFVRLMLAIVVYSVVQTVMGLAMAVRS